MTDEVGIKWLSRYLQMIGEKPLLPNRQNNIIINNFCVIFNLLDSYVGGFMG